MKILFEILSNRLPKHKPRNLPFALWFGVCLIHSISLRGFRRGLEMWRYFYVTPSKRQRLILGINALWFQIN